MSETAREWVLTQLAQAETRAGNPEVREHIVAAREVIQNTPTPLVECPQCGRQGLPERIAAHECEPSQSDSPMDTAGYPERP